jgi:hypothetical protein
VIGVYVSTRILPRESFRNIHVAIDPCEVVVCAVWFALSTPILVQLLELMDLESSDLSTGIGSLSGNCSGVRFRNELYARV